MGCCLVKQRLLGKGCLQAETHDDRVMMVQMVETDWLLLSGASVNQLANMR